MIALGCGVIGDWEKGHQAIDALLLESQACMAIGNYVQYHGNTIEHVDIYVIKQSTFRDKTSRQEQRLPCRSGRNK